MERVRAKLSRWPHLAHLRSGEGPGWPEGVAKRRGDKDREVENGRAIQGFLEAICDGLDFFPGMPPAGGFLQREAWRDLISPYMVHSGSHADYMQTTGKRGGHGCLGGHGKNPGDLQASGSGGAGRSGRLQICF